MFHLTDFARAARVSALVALPLLAASPTLAQTPGDSSPDGLWTFFDDVTLPADYSPPNQFSIAQLAAADMAALLATAPPENPSAPGDPVALFLPLPNGSFREVGAQSSLLMERSLAAMDRTKRPASDGSDARRIRSPNRAPPERLDEGSTAITPTVRPRCR